MKIISKINKKNYIMKYIFFISLFRILPFRAQQLPLYFVPAVCGVFADRMPRRFFFCKVHEIGTRLAYY